MSEFATGIPTLDTPSLTRRVRIPLWVKIAYSVFVCVMVLYYWQAYSPWNFLYICDGALILTVVALWTESSLLTSMQAVGVLVPQTVWVISFLLRMLGVHGFGLTDYMFNPGISILTRGISLFHGWLPLFLIYLLVKLGYDRRALAWQCGAGIALLTFCFLFAPRAPAPVDRPNLAVNVNYVWGPNDAHPQTWMPPVAWLGVLCAVFVFGFYVPTHLILRQVLHPPGNSNL